MRWACGRECSAQLVFVIALAALAVAMVGVLLGVQINSVRSKMHLFQNKIYEQIN